MGTDIYLTVELRQEDGRWRAVRPPGDPRDDDGGLCWDWDFGRSYACFAVLADVRNGLPEDGFFNPISEPRGLPEDRDPVDEDYGEYGQSWLLLPEILTYDWEQKTTWRSFVSEDRVKARLARPIPYTLGPPMPDRVYAEPTESPAAASSA